MNAIVYDFPGRENDVFAEGIIKQTGEEWEIVGLERGGNELKFVWNVFLNRNKYKKIVFWQQRHGIYYANLCNLFHVRKGPEAYILTFIYKQDPGFKGLLKTSLFKGAVKSKHITKIVCYSKHEVSYYGNVFNTPEGKFVSTTFGLNDQKYRKGESVITNEGFLIDAGRSNRDHKFLETALEGSDYKAIIADRTYFSDGGSNCTVRQDVKYGDDLYSLIEKSFAVIVPLEDKNISAGQTVFIQAMMFSKPIIVTSSNTIGEYVINGENGFIIDKTRESLLECLDKLNNDKELYAHISGKSRQMYEESYSFVTFGRHIGEIVGSK